MRGVSESTRDLTDEVQRLARTRPPPWREGELVRAIAERLERIVATGEWRAIPRIISLALDKRQGVAEAAGKAVRALAARVPLRELGGLDRLFRERSPYLHNEYVAWGLVDPGDLRKLITLEAGPTLLQLAMCHPSGYVREEAVRRSAICSDGSEIPFLLIRCNDWVRPVREAAQAAIRARLRPDCIADFVAALPMLEQAQAWRRLAGGVVLGRIERLLGSEEAAEPLREALNSRDRFLRRSCYRRALQSAHLSRRDVMARALRDDDAWIRVWACRVLCVADEAEFVEYAPGLLRAPLGSVRLAAAKRLIGLDERFDWPAFLYDVHAGVRAFAQECAIDGDVDVAGEYRRALVTERGMRLATALLGLGETGAWTDIETVRGHLGHAQSQVRSGALRALAALHDEEIVAHCRDALADDRPAVTHTARDLLRAGVMTVTPAAVWETFERVGTPHGKIDALAVLSGLDHWEQLPYLLRATAVDDARVRARATLAVSRWFVRQARVFTNPSRSAAKAISEALAAASIPEWEENKIRAVLRSRPGL